MGSNTKPMIFNGDMAKALRSERKTVTRRPVSKTTRRLLQDAVHVGEIHSATEPRDAKYVLSFAPVQTGDYIWVRETFCTGNIFEHDAEHPADRHLYIEPSDGNGSRYISKAYCEMAGDISFDDVRWTPSIHMPRAASLLTLRVTDVRIERVQDITEAQAKKEGVYPARPASLALPYRTSFMEVWDDIYQNWCDNPLVWVIEFEVIEKNIDMIARPAATQAER